jgi:hypothetical protein
MDLLEALGISPPAADSALCVEIYDDRYTQGNRSSVATGLTEISMSPAATAAVACPLSMRAYSAGVINRACLQARQTDSWKRYVSSACSCCLRTWRVTSGSMSHSGCRAAAGSCHHGCRRSKVGPGPQLG